MTLPAASEYQKLSKWLFEVVCKTFYLSHRKKTVDYTVKLARANLPAMAVGKLFRR